MVSWTSGTRAAEAAPSRVKMSFSRTDVSDSFWSNTLATVIIFSSLVPDVHTGRSGSAGLGERSHSQYGGGSGAQPCCTTAQPLAFLEDGVGKCPHRQISCDPTLQHFVTLTPPLSCGLPVICLTGKMVRRCVRATSSEI